MPSIHKISKTDDDCQSRIDKLKPIHNTSTDGMIGFIKPINAKINDAIMHNHKINVISIYSILSSVNFCSFVKYIKIIPKKLNLQKQRTHYLSLPSDSLHHREDYHIIVR